MSDTWELEIKDSHDKSKPEGWQPTGRVLSCSEWELGNERRRLSQAMNRDYPSPRFDLRFVPSKQS